MIEMNENLMRRGGNMAIFTFENEEVKEREEERVRTLFKLIKTESATNTWILVKEKKKNPTYWSGTYYNKHVHGFRKRHKKYLRSNQPIYNINHLIVLRIGKEVKTSHLANLIAHEYAHLLQYHNGFRRMTRGREKHANRWAIYRINQIKHLLPTEKN